MEKVFIRTNGTPEMNRKCVERLMQLGYKPVCDVESYVYRRYIAEFGDLEGSGNFHLSQATGWYREQGCEEVFLKEDKIVSEFNTKELLILHAIVGHVSGNAKENVDLYKKLGKMLEDKRGVKPVCCGLRGGITVNDPDVFDIVGEFAKACAKYQEKESLEKRIAAVKAEIEGGV